MTTPRHAEEELPGEEEDRARIVAQRQDAHRPPGFYAARTLLPPTIGAGSRAQSPRGSPTERCHTRGAESEEGGVEKCVRIK